MTNFVWNMVEDRKVTLEKVDIYLTITNMTSERILGNMCHTPWMHTGLYTNSLYLLNDHIETHVFTQRHACNPLKECTQLMHVGMQASDSIHARCLVWGAIELWSYGYITWVDGIDKGHWKYSYIECLGWWYWQRLLKVYSYIVQISLKAWMLLFTLLKRTDLEVYCNTC